MIRPKLLTVLFLFICCQLNAQQLTPAIFSQYTTANGLSSNSITGLAQDSTGYIWAATFSGLNRFDGSRFVQYHSNDDSSSPAAQELTAMSWLDSYRLAIHTAAGLHIVNTRTGEGRNLFVPYHRQQFLYKFNTIHGAKADDAGNIYMLTRSGFYHFKDFRLVSRFDYYPDEDLKRAHYHFGNTMLQIGPGKFVIVSEGGLFRYDRNEQVVKKLERGDYPLFDEFIDEATEFRYFQVKPGVFFIMKQYSERITVVDMIRNRKVYARLPFTPPKDEFHYRSRVSSINDSTFYITSHNAGFYKISFHPRTGSLEFHPEKYFASFYCSSILRDKDGNIWIGTNKGLFRQDHQKQIIQYGRMPSILLDSFPNIRMSDVNVSADKVYVGTRGEGGLLLFNKETLQFEEQILFDSKQKVNNQINAMGDAGNSRLLLGTAGVLFLFDKATKKFRPLIPPLWSVPNDWTNDVYKDRIGKVWISAGRNIYQFDPQSGDIFLMPVHERPMNFPVRMQQDKQGNIWMASHGLARYQSDAGAFSLVVDSFPFIKMADKQVNTFVFDRQNTLWFNSHNNGLIGYDISRNSFRHFTTRDGLPDNNIVSLNLVGDKLWMACYSGIACLDIPNSTILSFGKDDGFPDMPVLGGSRFFYDSTGRQLYLGFSHAIARFSPDQLLKKKSPPRLFIEDVSINNADIFLPPNIINTSWRDNEIKVAIGTINFMDPGTQRYAYRILRDSNSRWIEMGAQPSFSISSLAPGTHRVQVKVYSSTDRWPEQVKEFSIVVKPPFWLRGWFLFLAAVVVLLMIYWLIRWQKELARKKEMEKTYIEKLKVDHYKSQFELEQISNYFSSSLAGKKTEDEVLWDVAINLIGRMDYEDCVIYLWNKDKTKMVQKAAYGPKGAPEILEDIVFEVAPGQGIVGHVIETRQPVLVSDTRKDDRYRVDDQFRLSEVTVPIIHNDELLGVIDSEHSKVNYFSDRDIQILTTIATLIGNKLKQLESEKTLEAKQQELAGINGQLAEARLSALQAQMNPHFVFNALNSIKRMILDADNEKASRYMSKFAMMIRMTLEHSKELFVTLDENVEYLKAYLEMEKLRFDDSFAYSILVDENVDTNETLLPSMMIQPLVENAIWHGLMQAKRDKKLSIRFSQTETSTICTVEDNGIGIRRSEQLRDKQRPLHRSVGLQNLQNRIKIMNEKYDADCSLEIIDFAEYGRNGSGTKAVLQLKLMTI